jgi:hypothetical protein
MGQLALTFTGPFVIVLETSSVDVYAPKCPDHHAGIFTPNDQYPICGCFRNGGDYVYTLSLHGVDNNLDPISIPQQTESRIVDAQDGSKVDPAYANFCINVPRPKIIFPINPANTEVVTGQSPTGNPSDRATGMRFYYDCADLSKAVISLIPPPPDGSNALALNIDNLPSLPNYADIDITYADPAGDDTEHVDAMSCFDNTMQLLGLDWWLYYGQANTGTMARTGADCKSLPVVVGRKIHTVLMKGPIAPNA